MVAVDWQDRNQPTFKPTKAAPANSSRVEMPVAERPGGGVVVAGEKAEPVAGDLLAWEAVVFWWG